VCSYIHKMFTIISLKVASAAGCLSQPKASFQKALSFVWYAPIPKQSQDVLQPASQVPRFSFCDVFLLVDISRKTNQDKTKKHFVFFSTFIESFMIDQLILFFMFFGQKNNVLVSFWASMALTREH